MLEVALQHRWPGGFTLDVAFTAPPGVTALFGPSGCGKSTILAAVAGLMRPDAGRVTLDGAPWQDSTTRQHLPAERRGCGLVFQDARLFPHLSVRSNLEYGARRAPADRPAGPGFGAVVEMLGIGALLDRRPAGLSGGERQRVALGRALLSRPRLLLLDEPLAALDTARRAEVLPFLARLRDAAPAPILYVTHALEEVDALADHLVLLQAGRVQAAGPLEDLAARTNLPQLTNRRDAGAVLACTLAGHDAERGLSTLHFAGGALRVALRPEAPGTALRLRIRARDVAVATRQPEAISVQNILPAEVTAIDPAGPHEVFLRLGIGPATLLARITRDAVARLELAPGKSVFALIKSVSFDRAR